MHTEKIRLAELLPGKVEDEIRIRLVRVGESMETTPYEALSYVWGSRESDVVISVNDHPFEVSYNLGTALRRLRSETSHRTLWVDAVCINQSDIVEKAAQVGVMGRIYESAETVIIFLGDEEDGSDMVMTYLNLPPPEGTDHQEPQATDTPKKETTEERARAVEERITRLGFSRKEFSRAAEAFFQRPWWLRMWVVQEYVLSRDTPPLWYCGGKWTSTASMRAKIGQLYNYIFDQSMVGQGDPEIVNHLVTSGEEFRGMSRRKYNINLMLREPWPQILHPAGLLVRLLYRQSTDPRDRVFAMRELMDPISKEMFRPDYTVNLDRLFASMTAYLLLIDEWRVIFANFSLLRSPGAPSWTLDLTRPLPSPGEIGMLSRSGLEGGTTQYMDDPIRLSMCDGILGISGVEVDRIEHVFPIEETDDLHDNLRQWWKLNVILTRLQSSNPWPSPARDLFPGGRLLPISQFNWVNGDGILDVPLGVLLDLPGYFEMQMTTVATNLSLWTKGFDPPKMQCDVWRENGRKFGLDREVNTRVSQVMNAGTTTEYGDAFMFGAVFDRENLEQQIESVRAADAGREGEGRETSDGAKDNPDNQQRREEPREATHPAEPSLSEPDRLQNANLTNPDLIQAEYSQIKDILSKAESEDLLQILKRIALLCITTARKIVQRHKDDKPSTARADEILGSIVSQYQSMQDQRSAAWAELADHCTCSSEDEKTDHKNLLNTLINSGIESAATLRSMIELQLPQRKMGSHDAGPVVRNALRREYRCVFTTRAGLVGATFQKGAGFERGDEVVLFDGFGAAMVLEPEKEGRQQMKAAVAVMGLTEVSVEQLVDIGVCRKRDFRIV